LIDEAAQRYDILISNLDRDYHNVSVWFIFSPPFANLLVETHFSMSGMSYFVASSFGSDFQKYGSGTITTTSVVTQTVAVVASNKGGQTFLNVIQMTLYI
jgi:hypothetical protein